MPKYIDTGEAAKRLKVTRRRVQALIAAGRLRAVRLGRDWLIEPADLAAVRNRKPGRPRKPRGQKKRK